MSEINNLWYNRRFIEIYRAFTFGYPSLCGYFLFGSLKKGSDSPGDVDAIYFYDSVVREISPPGKIKMLDDLEKRCMVRLGIPIHRYEHLLTTTEDRCAFKDISEDGFESEIDDLLKHFPDLVIEDFRVNQKAKLKIGSILSTLHNI